jgi:hypothetical protein
VAKSVAPKSPRQGRPVNRFGRWFDASNNLWQFVNPEETPEPQRKELLSLKPGLWGISVDLKELFRRLLAWWRNHIGPYDRAPPGRPLAAQAVTNAPTRDTRILDRAYLRAEPRGLHEMTDGTVIAHVRFVNSGNLPARNIRNQIKIGWFDDGNKTDFAEVEITDPGSVLLVPKAEFERGTAALSKQDTDRYRLKEGFVYVWGRIEYEDGFGCSRWLIFCHRYNCTKPEILRLHHHQNDGN